MEIEIWKSSYPLDRLTVRAIPTQVVLSSFCLVQAIFVKVRISSKLDQVFRNRVKGFWCSTSAKKKLISGRSLPRFFGYKLLFGYLFVARTSPLIREMVQQVKGVLPHVPASVIANDLGKFVSQGVPQWLGSTPTQAWLLRLWIWCFTIIISAWWNLTSNKLKKSEAKFKQKTREQNNSEVFSWQKNKNEEINRSSPTDWLVGH